MWFLRKIAGPTFLTQSVCRDQRLVTDLLLHWWSEDSRPSAARNTQLVISSVIKTMWPVQFAFLS